MPHGDAPYDYTNLTEIIIFKGAPNTTNIIELSRDGKYINLVKPKESSKRYYRYDLNKKVFERINFYKTVPQKVTEVKVSNITSWFSGARIITKDIHFGRLILFAKFNDAFSKYSSPVRFIEQLGHKMITSIEQWEALGIKVKEMEEFFGPRLIGYKKDIRKDIYFGEESTSDWNYKVRYYGGPKLAPSDFSKELLQYILRNYSEVDNSLLYDFHSSYNDGEYHIEKELRKMAQDPEFAGIFHYTTQFRYYNGNNAQEKWVFGTNSESRRIKINIIHLIKEYNLDLYAFCRWLKKQINVDKNDAGYLFGNGHHYADYLECEKELCDGRLSKMNKYPDNFRSEFHRVEAEYNIKKADIDEAKFEQQAEKNQELEHIGRKFIVKIPRHIAEIHDEAAELNHCVRTYIPRVVDGKTLILFLREKDNSDKPLVTLEVKKGALTQAYGKNDMKPLKEHLDFLKMWCSMKNLKVGCWKKDLS